MTAPSIRQPAGRPNPLEAPYFFTIAQDGEQWVAIVDHGRHVLCMRRGTWDDVQDWVKADWPDAHARAAHAAGGPCLACARQTWRRR